LQLLKALPIRVESRDLWTKVNLESQARQWDLAAYDAAYLELALHNKLPLTTTDTNLRKAAESQSVQIFS
jgi:predicted nucleic acid-binding protein